MSCFSAASEDTVKLIDKIAEFLKKDLPETFHFPKFKEITEHLTMATVNGKDIVITDLKREMDNILPMASHRRIAEARRKELLQKALDNLIVEELYYQKAVSRRINVKKYLVNKIEDIKKSYRYIDDFYNDLKELGVSMERLIELIERKIMIQRVIKREIGRLISVNDKDVFEYYRSHKERFVIPEKRKLRSLTIRVPAEDGSEYWKNVENRLKNIQERFLKGADFVSLAFKYSEDEYRDKGGDMGFIHKGVLMPPVDEAVFSMKTGEVSDIIGTIYGYCIIRVEEIIPAREREFEEINKDELKRYIKKLKFEERLNEWTQMLKREADIKILRYQ